ncbi:MAG TPA: response regulator [Blastocatellia bacterium]|nr:response regulator [Blastocatellia bacterium]
MIRKEFSALIVDDDEDTRAMFARILATSMNVEFTCATAASVEEAMKLLEASRFHLVLTDINLPGRSGLDLCESVQQSYPITPVIVVSGMTDIQYAVEAIRRRAFDYLVKPVAVEQLKWSVERALTYHEVAMLKYNCEQSIQEDIHDLMLLNQQLRSVAQPAVKGLSKPVGTTI